MLRRTAVSVESIYNILTRRTRECHITLHFLYDAYIPRVNFCPCFYGHKPSVAYEHRISECFGKFYYRHNPFCCFCSNRSRCIICRNPNYPVLNKRAFLHKNTLAVCEYVIRPYHKCHVVIKQRRHSRLIYERGIISPALLREIFIGQNNFAHVYAPVVQIMYRR
jgi:hypothetical protein